MKKLIIYLLLYAPLLAAAQNPAFPDLSPQVFVRQEIGNTNMELTYSRPAVRGRKIFGHLVPFGKLWRTGAAECSTLYFDREVSISGRKVPAGKYALLTIPGEKTWEIILNQDTTLYGVSGYEASKDILRFKVPAEQTSEVREAFSIHLDFIPNDARLTIAWERMAVSFLIETSTDEEMSDFIRTSLLTKKEVNDENYIGAADYLLMNNLDILQAFTLTSYALEIKDSEYVRSTRVSILERLGRKQEAKQEVFAAIELVKTSKTLNEKDKKQSLEYWETRLKELN